MNQTFQVQGMTCQHCVRAVEDAAQALDTDASVRVDLSTGRVEVQSQQPHEASAAAIADAGYTVQA